MALALGPAQARAAAASSATWLALAPAAFVLMAVPIYFNQIGVKLASPITVRVLLALGPVFLIVLQTAVGGLALSGWSLAGVLIYCAIAIGAVFVRLIGARRQVARLSAAVRSQSAKADCVVTSTSILSATARASVLVRFACRRSAATKRVHLAEWDNWTKLAPTGPFLTGVFRPLPSRTWKPPMIAFLHPKKPLSVAALFDGQQPSEAATAALLAHPRFVEAGRIVAAGLVDLYQGERTVNLVMPDRVRYIISVFAVHLHFAGRPNDPNSGLTASRLCKLCVERKVCSAGRAESMLGIMREFGHLVPAPSEEDMRLRRLVPAEPLFAWHRKRCMHFFAAAAKVLPDDADALAALDAPGFMPRISCAISAGAMSPASTTSSMFRTIRLFYERSAGGAILMSIMLAGAGDDTFPPSRPVSISLSGLARDFEVSRVHVRRLVQEGVSAGLLNRVSASGDELEVAPRLSDAVRRVVATYMLHYTHCARLACADMRQESVT